MRRRVVLQRLNVGSFVRIRRNNGGIEIDLRLANIGIEVDLNLRINTEQLRQYGSLISDFLRLAAIDILARVVVDFVHRG